MSVSDPHRLQIVTEDGIGFSVQLASPIVRALAMGIDFIVVIGIQSILQTALKLLAVFSVDFMTGLTVIGFFAISTCYGMIAEYRLNGQTIGKRFIGLRVMDVRARRLTGSQIIVRNLMRVVDMFPLLYVLGGLVALSHPRFQRLGDIVAGTLVVRLPPEPLPLPGELNERKYNSFRKYPQVEAQIQRMCTPEDVALLVETLHRRNDLEADNRIQLFREMTAMYQKRIRFPDELCEGLNDEAFILNLLDSLTRNQREL